MRQILIRVMTALVLIGAALAWLFLLDYHLFAIGALLLYVLCAFEMGPLLGYRTRLPFVCLAAVASSVAFYFAQPGHYVDQDIPMLVKWIIGSGCLVWLLAVRPIVRYPRSQKWRKYLPVTTIVGLLMLLPFLEGILVLRSMNFMQDPKEGAYLLLAVMILVWCTDSGAYFTGRFIGRHKLMRKSQVSPNKTKEGLVGGIVCAAAGAVILVRLDWFSVYGDKLLVISCSVAATIVFAVIGDLAESLIKRLAGVKDSGAVFPGHGGFLDRLDSQLAAVPVFLTVNWVVSGTFF